MLQIATLVRIIVISQPIPFFANKIFWVTFMLHWEIAWLFYFLSNYLTVMTLNPAQARST